MAKNEYMVLDSTRICPVCMKEFFIPDIEQWAYKHWETNKKKKRIYFCSWGCMRKYVLKRRRFRQGRVRG